MSVQSVQVRFNPDRYVEDTSGHREAVLPNYTIAIPQPGSQNPVMVTALRPDNTALNEDGNYVDPLVQQAADDGYEFHRIVDEGGNTVTVMMTANDWTSYQSSLSTFAQAAARSPNLYQPNAASQPFGLFRGQVQAGGGAPSLVPFRPITPSQMQKSGVIRELFTTLGSPVDITMYTASNAAQRTVLLNAGYVEINVSDPDHGTVPRFVSPMDARIHAEVPRGTGITRFELPW